MKNTWKGLVVGALTGMLGGAALDAASRAGRSAASMVGKAREPVPAVARMAGHEAAETGTAPADKVKDPADRVVAGIHG